MINAVANIQCLTNGLP